jgi:hypothetical protein
MTPTEEREQLAISREMLKLSIQGIRLGEASCKVGELKPDGTLPTVATQNIALGVHVDPKNNTIVVAVALKLLMGYQDALGSEPPIQITGTYSLQYGCEKPELTPLFQTAVNRAAMFHAIPFWREFVHSMSARMGVPSIVIPIVNLAQLTKAPDSSQVANDEQPPKGSKRPSSKRKAKS